MSPRQQQGIPRVIGMAKDTGRNFCRRPARECDSHSGLRTFDREGEFQRSRN